MPKSIALTKSVVDRLPFTARGQAYYYDALLTGFGLRVGRTSKAYFAEWRVGGRTGRTVRKTIGKHGAFTPDIARKHAMALLAGMQLGEDPFIEERRQRVVRISLLEAHQAFLAARKNLKPNTLHGYAYCFARYFGDWQDKPLNAITREMVARRHALIGQKGFPMLRALAREPRPSPAHANQAMRYLRALYNFAMHRYEPHIQDNPVKFLSFTRAWFRDERRQTYLKVHEIKPWFRAVMALENDAQSPTRESLRDYMVFLLFTGLRREEAARLTWNNVDLKARTVLFPDTKNREPHILPLPDYLLQLLKRRQAAAPEHARYVFHGEGPGGRLGEPRKQVLRVCAVSGVQFRLHDLRRSFATHAEGLDIPAYALKRLLNHKVRNDITASYIVADVERLRRPMQKITDFLLKAAGVKASAEIKPMRRAAGRSAQRA